MIRSISDWGDIYTTSERSGGLQNVKATIKSRSRELSVYCIVDTVYPPSLVPSLRITNSNIYYEGKPEFPILCHILGGRANSERHHQLSIGLDPIDDIITLFLSENDIMIDLFQNGHFRGGHSLSASANGLVQNST
jgi:hypothetical protein